MRRVSSALVWVVVACFAAVTLHAVAADRDQRDRAAQVSLRSLVAATTEARLPRAPRDPDPQGSTHGPVVRPLRTVPGHATPDGRRFAKVPREQFGPTWLPVVDERPGWVRVLLPSRPYGATGWLRTGALEQRRTASLVRVHRASRTLALEYDGRVVGTAVSRSCVRVPADALDQLSRVGRRVGLSHDLLGVRPLGLRRRPGGRAALPTGREHGRLRADDRGRPRRVLQRGLRRRRRLPRPRPGSRGVVRR